MNIDPMVERWTDAFVDESGPVRYRVAAAAWVMRDDGIDAIAVFGRAVVARDSGEEWREIRVLWSDIVAPCKGTSSDKTARARAALRMLDALMQGGRDAVAEHREANP